MQPVDIAPQGNLMLVVQNETELRVHSFVMQLHSPDCLGPLLGPKFAQGQAQGTATKPYRVQLPEESAMGMMILCSIFHLRHDLLDARPTGKTIRELAIIADKYNCVTKIQPYVGQWLNAVNVDDTMYAGSWLHVLYILNDAGGFSRASEQLIRHFRDIKAISQAFDGDDLADETIQSIKALIVSSANKQLGKVSAIIEEAVGPLLACLTSEYKHSVNEIPHIDREPPLWDNFDDRTKWSQIEEQCKYLQKYVHAQLEALVNAKIYPPLIRPNQLQSLLDKIAAFETVDFKRSERCCSDHGWCDDDRTDDFPSDVEDMKKAAAALNFGLCLDCFKAGGWNDGKCRVHPNKKKAAED